MLDQEILEWYETVPEKIKISGLGNLIPKPGTATYNTERLQIWTRLRLNQVRRGSAASETLLHLLKSATDSDLALHSSVAYGV